MNDFSELNALALWDFRIASYEGDTLVLLGSTDFAYYHQAEIRFHRVSYLECATSFCHARFGVASKQDSDRIRARSEEEDIAVYAITADADERGNGTTYFIAAERADCSIGTVYYYRRDNLRPGERIAPWVK